MRKLRKLRRDPIRFAYDFLGKRLPPVTPGVGDSPSRPGGVGETLADTDAVRASGGAAGAKAPPSSKLPDVAPAPGFGVARDLSEQDEPIFDLELFAKLNDEYRSKPTVPAPPRYDDKSLRERGEHRVERLNQLVPLAGARVLEIGCGQGEVVRSIAATYPACEVVGVDVLPRARWSQVIEPNATVMAHDISSADNKPLGKFDLIVAITVWEHVHHPYAALKAVRSLLAPGGKAYLTINLHRGTHASHLYRDVFFPWPHLLFSDQVFRDYYASIGKEPVVPAWVNRLTSEQYTTYFAELGLAPETLTHRTSLIDEDFYSRFADQLSRYPRRDLAREYLNVVLTHPS